MSPFSIVPQGLWDIIFTSNPAPMALAAPTGAYNEVNDAYCRLTKRSRSELLRLRFQDITRDEDLDVDVARAGRVRDRNIESYEMVKAYVGPDGSELIWVRLGVQGVYQDNVLVCFLSVAIPVSAPTPLGAVVPVSGIVAWWKRNWPTLLPYAAGTLAASYIWFAEWSQMKHDRNELIKRLERLETTK
jgi:PAS domain S-box-containing protein